MKNLNKAQSILGFAVLFLVIMAIFMVMHHHLRGSMSGKIRQVGDSIGAGEQYDPGTKADYGAFGTGSATTGSSN